MGVCINGKVNKTRLLFGRTYYLTTHYSEYSTLQDEWLQAYIYTCMRAIQLCQTVHTKNANQATWQYQRSTVVLLT